jgi:hypothetical protein
MAFREILCAAGLVVALATTAGHAGQRDLGYASDANGAVTVSDPPISSNEIGVLDEADGGGVEVPSGSDQGTLPVAVAPESSIMAALLSFAGFSQ